MTLRPKDVFEAAAVPSFVVLGRASVSSAAVSCGFAAAAMDTARPSPTMAAQTQTASPTRPHIADVRETMMLRLL